MFAWSGLYNAKEEALAHALRWLVGRAREEHAIELAAIHSRDLDFPVYQAITWRAEADKRQRESESGSV